MKPKVKASVSFPAGAELARPSTERIMIEGHEAIIRNLSERVVELEAQAEVSRNAIMALEKQLAAVLRALDAIRKC